jgi:uncharacterized protein
MNYTTDLEAWRTSMEASLRAEDGWLALAGLFWLNEGNNTIGADEACDVILPAGTAPAAVGHFERSGSVVTLFAQPGIDLLVNNEPVGVDGRVLHSDAGGAGKPDLVTIGSLVMFVIIRGERIGIRLRDTQHPKRQQFEGRIWYPVQPEYCVQAVFTAYETPQTIAIPNILGDVEQQLSPGFVSFELAGQTCRLLPTSAGERLFFIVRDATSGHDTYGGWAFSDC